MLSGVRSRLTYASLVTCSMRPPSHAFQLRVMVSAIASAISTTSTGVPNRRQAAFSGLIVCSICGSWGRDDWGCGHFDVLRPMPHCRQSQVARI